MAGTRLRDIVRFTPHCIEDILRRETIREDDKRRDSEDERVAPLNLSKYHMAETDGADRAFDRDYRDRETENTCTINTQLETKYRNTNHQTLSRRKKMRCTF